MQIHPVYLFGPVQLPTGGGGALLYTSPINAVTIVKKAVFTNTDSSTRTITIYIVRTGGSLATTNRIIFQTLPANSQFIAGELSNQVLQSGDSIWGTCDAGAVMNGWASGWRY